MHRRPPRRRAVLALLARRRRRRRRAAADRDRRPGDARRPTCAPTPSERSRARRSTPTPASTARGGCWCASRATSPTSATARWRSPGNPQTGSVRQRAWSASQGPGDAPSVEVGNPEVLFEAADGHDHFHLKNAMRYSLWNLQKTAQVAPGQKAGFCLYDIEDAPSPAPPPGPAGLHGGRHPLLRAGRPRLDVACAWARRRAGATCTPSTSPTSGWTCRTRRPGRYLVGSEADPENRIWEGGGAAEVNPPAFAEPAGDGARAGPPSRCPQPQSAAAQAVSLAAAEVRLAGQRQPALPDRQRAGRRHAERAGRRAASTRRPSSSSTRRSRATWRPTLHLRRLLGGLDLPGHARPSRRPRSSAPPPSVAISGMPLRLVAGSSVQLRATVANLPGRRHLVGHGRDGLGRPASTGPRRPPPKGGVVTVTATSTANPSVAGTAATGHPPEPRRRRRARHRRAGRGRQQGCSRGSLTGHVGRRVILAKVQVGGRRGTLRFTATVKRAVVGRCAIGRVGARKTVTCKITMKRPYPLKKVRFTARFTVGHRQGRRAPGLGRPLAARDQPAALAAQDRAEAG